MFSRLFGRKRSDEIVGPKDALALSDTLRLATFGLIPISELCKSGTAEQEPWKTLCVAQAAIETNDEEAAIQALRALAQNAATDPRIKFVAWRALKALNVEPEACCDVLGVVIEIGLADGTDTLAAYAHGAARYYNQSGAAAVSEGAEQTFRELTLAVCASAEPLGRLIGVWNATLPFQPRNDEARVTVLTPGGLRFGEGPFKVLAREPLAAPIFSAGLRLVQYFVKRTNEAANSARG